MKRSPLTDAVSNPIIGIVIDRMHEKRPHKAGKFRPWMLRTAPLMTITAIVVFTAPSFLDGMAKLVVIFTSYLFYGVIYNMFNVPYGSLMSAMAKDEDERARLSSARGMGGMGGNFFDGMFDFGDEENTEDEVEPEDISR